MNWLDKTLNYTQNKIVNPIADSRLARTLASSAYGRALQEAKPFNLGANSNSRAIKIGGGLASGLLNPFINVKNYGQEAANQYYNVAPQNTTKLIGMGGGAALDLVGMLGGSRAARELAGNAAKLTNLKKPIAGYLANSAKQGVKYGAAFGGGYGMFNSLANNDSLRGTLSNTAMGAGVGGLAGGVMGWGIPAGSAMMQSLKGNPANTFKQVGKSIPKIGMSIEAMSPENKLLTIHNLNERKLRFADRIGGLPNPSMAVIDPAKTPFDNYGDISLIPPKDILRGEKTHLADAYTARFPSVHSSLSYKNENALMNAFEPYYKKIGPDARKIILSGSDDAVREIENNPAVALKFLEANNITPSPEGQHYYHSQIQESGMDGKFQVFLDSIYKKYGLEEKLFGGYTNSGKRRYRPLDINEASKIMSKQKDEGFNYGLGSYRSKLAPIKRSPEAIRREANRLMSKPDFEKVKTQYEQELSNIQDSLSKHAINKDSNQFIEYDRQNSAIGSVLMGERDAMTYFKNKFGDNVPPKILNDIYTFRNKLKNMPTEYFETKLKRPVRLDEFSHALTPDTTPDEVISLLKKHGINPIKYAKGGKQKELIKLLGNSTIAFSLMAALGINKLNQK